MERVGFLKKSIAYENLSLSCVKNLLYLDRRENILSLLTFHRCNILYKQFKPDINRIQWNKSPIYLAESMLLKISLLFRCRSQCSPL